LMITSFFLEKVGNKKKRDKVTRSYSKPEDEIYLRAATLSFEFSIDKPDEGGKRTLDCDVEMHKLVMIIPHNKIQQIVEEISATLTNL